MIKYARGTIWWSKLKTDELTTSEGTHIQYGERPVLIISNDNYNATRAIVTVIPLTTSRDDLPYHIDISTPHKDSFALIDQIRPIDKSDLDNYMGMIEMDKLECIENNLRLYFDLGCF